MMEKYGVSDVAALQRQELGEVRRRLTELRNRHEKTAAEHTTLLQLENREAELQFALRQ